MRHVPIQLRIAIDLEVLEMTAGDTPDELRALLREIDTPSSVLSLIEERACDLADFYSFPCPRSIIQAFRASIEDTLRHCTPEN